MNNHLLSFWTFIAFENNATRKKEKGWRGCMERTFLSRTYRAENQIKSNQIKSNSTSLRQLNELFVASVSTVQYVFKMTLIIFKNFRLFVVLS